MSIDNTQGEEKMDFTFAANRQILFGREKSLNLPVFLKSLTQGKTGSLLMLCSPTLRRSSRFALLEKKLERGGFFTEFREVSGEPSPETVDALCKDFRKHPPLAVAALGGGSVLDTGKAVSAMLMEEGSVQDFLEGVGHRKPSGRKIPFAALPTTPGTGSECTKNAVISRPGPEGFKKSLRHDNFIPDLALVDPVWLEKLPVPIAASCGMDAFSQLLESYISTQASPITDALARQGLAGFFQAFTPLLKGQAKAKDFDAIALGAALSGLTLANAGLGTVHGIAGVLGGLSPVPHGRACGLLMPPVMKGTFKKLKNRLKENPLDASAKKVLSKLEILLPGKGITPLEEQLEQWKELAALPGLKASGVDESLLPKAAKASGNKNNPALFSEDERLKILRSIF